MGKTTDLRHALKATFIPHVQALGFEIDQRHAPAFLYFRRTRNGRVQIMEIQWEKYGKPRFKFSFSSISQAGASCHGIHVLASEAGPSHAPCCVCLYPTGNGSSTRHWFCQDYSLIDTFLKMRRLKQPEAVCNELLQLFPEVETYLDTGVSGSHCRIYKTGFIDAAN
jgi:hypothetical protein